MADADAGNIGEQIFQGGLIVECSS